MLLSNEKPIICAGTVNVQGDASSRSKLIVQTLPRTSGTFMTSVNISKPTV